VPEAYAPQSKFDAMDAMEEKVLELDKVPTLTSQEKMEELINYADELGYLFSDLVAEISLDDKDESTTMQSDEEDKLTEIDEGDKILNGFRCVSIKRPMMRESMVGLNRRVRRTSVSEPSRQSLASTAENPVAHRATMNRGNMMSMAGKKWNAINNNMTNMNEQMEELNSFKPWESDSTEAVDFVKALCPEQVLRTWGVLYCGGKSPLAEKVEKVSAEYNLKIALESFAW
jgi:hypothetical protein